MNTKEKTKANAHHAMTVVGGFMGIYALMTRNSTLGSSETYSATIFSTPGNALPD